MESRGEKLTAFEKKEQRNGLPITDFKQDILTLVAQHQVIIISGETGW